MLERELTTAVLTLDELRRATEELGAERDAYATETVLPRFGLVQTALAEGHPDTALSELTTMTRDIGGRPIYGTMEEFDLWMADEHAGLSLNPNWWQNRSRRTPIPAIGALPSSGRCEA